MIFVASPEIDSIPDPYGGRREQAGAQHDCRVRVKKAKRPGGVPGRFRFGDGQYE